MLYKAKNCNEMCGSPFAVQNGQRSVINGSATEPNVTMKKRGHVTSGSSRFCGTLNRSDALSGADHWAVVRMSRIVKGRETVECQRRI